MSLDREQPQFFDNRAQLYIVRTDLKFGGWEGLLEGRMLDMTDLNEQRSGALVAVYRYVGKHFKVGAGYNFTDFSEDLTDLSFRQRGRVHQHDRLDVNGRTRRMTVAVSNVPLINVRTEFEQYLRLFRNAGFKQAVFGCRLRPVRIPSLTWNGLPNQLLTLMVQRTIVGLECYVAAAVEYEFSKRGPSAAGSRQ